MAVDFTQEIKELRATMDSVRGVTDLDALGGRIADLEQQAAAPDLWDDPDKAQKVTSALCRASPSATACVAMDERIDDLEMLVELATEEADQATLAEAERDLAACRRPRRARGADPARRRVGQARRRGVTIRSGAGGVDAADFAEMLMRMYLRWAERHGYPTRVLDTSYAEEAGLKSATFEVNAPYAYGTSPSRRAPTASCASARSTTRAGARRGSRPSRSSRSSRATDHVEIPDTEIKVDVFRSSGPGGQSVNTTDSAVRLTHLPTGIVVSMQNEKSQIQNRAAALRVLQSRLLLQRKEQEAAAEEGDGRRRQGELGRPDALATSSTPYQMVKDLRTELRVRQPQAVFDGEIDEFIDAGIRWQIGQKKAAAV